jgi:hypothetical protein
MMPVIGWRVYCADGSTYDRDPHLIPPTVQAVVYFHEYPYRTLAHGEDTYEVDGVTLHGAWMDYDQFLAIVQRSAADMGWPK